MNEDLRYPIGKFQFPDSVSDADLKRMIGEIADAPSQLYEVASILDHERLQTPYRPGGWTLEQVIHHLPDSHLNSYIRFKLAVTEDEPTIRTYDEGAWADLPDSRDGLLLSSLELLDALHARWVFFIRRLHPAELERTFNHPEMGSVSLAQNIALYAWHGRHHVAHITSLCKRMGWD